MQSRELVKLYYRIGEVSEIVGVQPHVLRYWETEFRSIRPQKSSKGQRVYSRRDVEKLLRVKDLLRNQGFTIAGARKRLSDAPEAQPALAVPAPAVATEVEAAAVDTGAEHSAKDMRKALLGLRQDLMRMLDEISSIQSRGHRPPGSASASSVSTGSVSTGSVSTGSVSTGSVSTGSVSTGNGSAGSSSPGKSGS